MKRFILFAFLFSLFNFTKAQYFVGKIIYSVSYHNNKTKKADTSLSLGLGSEETFYIKNGDYLIKGNGSSKEWSLYKSSTNRIYEKYSRNDTVYAIDAGINNNTIRYKYHYKNVTSKKSEDTIKGKIKWIELHDREYVFDTENGVEYFYYFKKYKINAKLFSQHKYWHWGDFVTLSNSIPHIIIFQVDGYTCEKMAYDDFISEKLDDSLFDLPKNLLIKEKKL